MSNVVYTNGRTGDSILAIDSNTLTNQEIEEISLNVTSQTPTVHSEAAFLEINNNPTPSSSTVETMSAFVSNQAIQLALDQPLNLSLAHQSVGQSAFKTDMLVEQVILPESYLRYDEIPKWDRLCYEQQKAMYSTSPWWTDISGFSSEEATSGWFPGQFLFPVIDPANYQANIPTQCISSRSPDGINYNINAIKTNKTIEDIKIVYRRKGAYTSYDFESSYTDWQSVDPEDEPLKWQGLGKYEISSYPEIDQKQVPLIHSSKLVQDPITVNIQDSIEPITSIIPRWSGDNVDFYFYNAFESNVNSIKIYKDNVLLKSVSLSNFYNKSFIPNIDTNVTTRKPITYFVEFIHKDDLGGLSWIRNVVVKTQRPMVSNTATSIELSSKDLNSEDSSYFILKVPSDKLEKLYKPVNLQTAFTIDLNPESFWLTSIKNKKLVVRLSVCKYWQGNKIEIGNFIFNPLSADGTNIDGVYTDSGVLSYEPEDNLGDGSFSFRFNPYAGILSTLEVKENEIYEFRIAEWTLGVEQGILSGQNLAWMKPFSPENPDKRYRYDSWDEEHPVRFWSRMSPIDPVYDSADRLSQIAKSRINITSNLVYSQFEQPTIQISHHRILNSIVEPNWKTLYGKLKDKNYFGTWRRFEFAFQISSLFKNAEKIELHASYFGYFQIPPGSDGTVNSNANSNSLQSPSIVPVWVPLPLNGQPSQEAEEKWIPIAQWAHWSDTLHICDFVSYQYVFSNLFNLASQNFESFKHISKFVKLEDYQEGIEAESQTKTVSTPLDAFLGVEQHSAWEEMNTGISRWIEAYMKEGVRIKYKATIIFNDGTKQELYLTSIETRDGYAWSDSRETTLYGQPMNFEIVQEPADNPTWVSGNFEVVTKELDSYIGIKLDPEETVQVTPGLRPAQVDVSIDFDTIDIRTIDTKQFILDDGIPKEL